MNKNIKYSQNFLTSEKVLNQIIKQLNLKETDTVYEIGTGKGHLTTKLAKISKQVTSIELDSHLFNLSSEKLKLNNSFNSLTNRGIKLLGIFLTI